MSSPGATERGKSSLAIRLHSRFEALKPRRRKKAEDEAVTYENEDANARSLGKLFFALPVELQQQIVSYSDIYTVLSVRAASKALALLVYQTRNYTTQQYIATRFQLSCGHLCRKAPFGAYYLYHICHVHATASAVAHLLADFIDTEILQDVGERLEARERSRLVSLAIPPLLILAHFYTTLRQWMLLYYPRTKDNGWSDLRETAWDHVPKQDAYCSRTSSDSLFCSKESLEHKEINSLSVFEFISRMMSRCYGPDQLESAWDMEKFLTSTLRRLLRKPTYLSFIERMPRPNYSIAGRPAQESVESLLVIGGLDVARRVLSQTTDMRRIDEVAQWRKSLQASLSTKWMENWKYTIYGPFANNLLDTESTFHPPAWFGPDWLNFWGRPARQVLEGHGREVGSKSTRVYVSEMVGYDILRATRWAY